MYPKLETTCIMKELANEVDASRKRNQGQKRFLLHLVLEHLKLKERGLRTRQNYILLKN